ncbi:MAG: site-2 protease family protein [Bryobacteraceae bacterium]|jgi:Zn-dependent protease
MNRHTIPLGRILGIPIGLDYSWFLIFGLITWTMAVGYYPAEFKNWPAVQYWIMGAATAIMLFVSVLLHELGHSAVAMSYKIKVRSITLLIFGGISQIGAEPPSAAAQFWISIAGPAVSFALAGVFFLLQSVFTHVAPLLALDKYLVYINIVLGLFNLIPGFPLDGGGVFRAAVWGITHNLRRATLVAANLGRFIAFFFIGLGVWQMLAGNLINGMWIAFIGWFLENAAKGQVQQLAFHDMLAGHNVSQAMNRHYTAVPADTTLQRLVDVHILGSGLRSFVVKRSNEVVGLLTLHHVKEVPRSEWSTTTSAQAMIPIEQTKRVQPDAELWTALEEMDRDGVNQLPVMTDGHIQGMLSREDVITFLRTIQEVGT